MSSLPPEEPALWYEDKVRRYGYDHRGLGFRNKSSQEKRFEALLDLGDFDGSRSTDDYGVTTYVWDLDLATDTNLDGYSWNDHDLSGRSPLAPGYDHAADFRVRLTVFDAALNESLPSAADLGERIRRRFAALGDVQLPIAAREPVREPPIVNEASSFIGVPGAGRWDRTVPAGLEDSFSVTLICHPNSAATAR